MSEQMDFNPQDPAEVKQVWDMLFTDSELSEGQVKEVLCAIQYARSLAAIEGDSE